MPEGTARKIAIIVLSILLAVLVVIAVVIFINTRNRAVVIVNGATCNAGAVSQCEGTSSGGNTGNLCSCVTGTNGTSVWSCETQDLARCPITTTATCQPNEVQTGSCGGSGCLPTQKPVQACGADGKFGAITCVTDTTCTGGSSSSQPSLNCEISGDNKTLSISANCPTDFSYLVKLHVVDAPANAEDDSDCSIAFSPEAQVFNGTPGSTYTIDPSEYSCGKCVRYELTQTPQSAFIKASSTYVFTGLCSGTTPTSTSSTASSSTTDTETSSSESSDFSSYSSEPAELPDTGLFDDPNNVPLLFGLTLIMMGLSFNRVWWLWKGDE